MSAPNSQSESDLADEREVSLLLTLQERPNGSKEKEKEKVEEEESSLQEQQERLNSLTVVGPSRTINDLAVDTLLQIFSHLNTWELLLMRRVCKRWKMDVEGEIELWMKLLLFEKKGARFTEKLMKAALERSNNGLREIVVEVGYDAGKFKDLRGLIMRCKNHLTVLDLSITQVDGLIFEWSDFWKDLPHLKSYRFFKPSIEKIVDIQLKVKKVKHVDEDLIEGDYWRNEGQDPWLVKDKDEGKTVDEAGKGKEKEQEGEEEQFNESTLKVLWIGDFGKVQREKRYKRSIVAPLSSFPQLYSLVSIRVETASSTWDWYQLLKICHRTLKHLDIKIKEGTDAEQVRNRNGQIITPLEFPNLRVLKLKANRIYEDFPSWVRVPGPDSLTFVSGNFWNGLPDFNELWVKSVKDYERLIGRCESLKTVRVTSHKCSLDDLDCLIALGTQRPNVRLIFPVFKSCTDKKLEATVRLEAAAKLEALGSMGVDVVDSKGVTPLIELQVEC